MRGSTMDSAMDSTINYTTSVNNSNYKDRKSIRLGITIMVFHTSFFRDIQQHWIPTYFITIVTIAFNSYTNTNIDKVVYHYTGLLFFSRIVFI